MENKHLQNQTQDRDIDGSRPVAEAPFYNQVFEEAYRFIIDYYRIKPRRIALFIPCAVRKPYSASPSHRLFQRLFDEILDPSSYHKVVFGTCGTVPAELERMYPYAHYRFMLGRVKDERIKRDFLKIERYRLEGYLEKTRDTYKYRTAYCLGLFREAMEGAIRATEIPVEIFPSQKLINENYSDEHPFPEGSLSLQAYLNEFREGLCRIRDEK